MTDAPSNFTRGEIRWANVPSKHVEGSEQFKNRCWVIVSNNTVNARYPVVVGVPLSESAKPNSPTRVIVEPDDVEIDPGQNAVRLVAMAEQVRVLSVRRFTHRYGTLSKMLLMRLETALRFALNLP